MLFHLFLLYVNNSILLSSAKIIDNIGLGESRFLIVVKR